MQPLLVVIDLEGVSVGFLLLESHLGLGAHQVLHPNLPLGMETIHHPPADICGEAFIQP